MKSIASRINRACDSRIRAPLIETRRAGGTVVPAIVAAAGDGAARRFLEFFAVTIDNQNTRAAYFHACRRFFAWCDRRDGHRRAGRDRADACRGLHPRRSASEFEKPTVKQHLAAIRMLFDWLVIGQIVAINPAHAVRGPKHVVKTGKTTVLTANRRASCSTASMCRRSSACATAR